MEAAGFLPKARKTSSRARHSPHGGRPFKGTKRKSSTAEDGQKQPVPVSEHKACTSKTAGVQIQGSLSTVYHTWPEFSRRAISEHIPLTGRIAKLEVRRTANDNELERQTLRMKANHGATRVNILIQDCRPASTPAPGGTSSSSKLRAWP